MALIRSIKHTELDWQ